MSLQDITQMKNWILVANRTSARTSCGIRLANNKQFQECGRRDFGPKRGAPCLPVLTGHFFWSEIVDLEFR